MIDKPEKTQVPLGAWSNLPTAETQKKSKVVFEINKSVRVEFLDDEPKEYQGDNGAFYVFNVRCNGEDMAIVTSAWTLLYELKRQSPLKNKQLTITKKLIKGKNVFEVI